MPVTVLAHGVLYDASGTKYRTLETNVLVQPDAPVNVVLLVNYQLLPKKIIPLVVDLHMVRFFFVCVHSSELTIPYLMRYRVISTQRVARIVYNPTE